MPSRQIRRKGRDLKQIGLRPGTCSRLGTYINAECVLLHDTSEEGLHFETLCKTRAVLEGVQTWIRATNIDAMSGRQTRAAFKTVSNSIRVLGEEQETASLLGRTMYRCSVLQLALPQRGLAARLTQHTTSVSRAH